ncbi:GNAT family N-acetyltransferase [Exiguobacterium sp. 17-1]|uniref:lipid II:glycine glycyltransferase FemX n=1 Tax=Exiguobacterium TaxID=33986 RepID=UPI001FFF63D9|nr:GNAT family N-acetyltransferase [Exiguobacterium sp. 17-1]MCK2156226.1 GNAT family N-acetyltransferase [Exiguobacterium sp. 17-1]
MMSLSNERLIHDPREWNALVVRYGLDCYYEYAYFELAAEPEAVPEMYIHPSEFGILIYPYLKRKITGTSFQDLTTPYGYGGPVFVGRWSSDQVEDIRRHFLDYCHAERIVSETIRFHPLLENDELGRIWCETTKVLQPTVTVDLTDPLETIESRFSSMTRRNIKKAIREDVTVRVAGQDEYDSFIRLYRLTMDKHQADARYYFTDHYFRQFQDGQLPAELLVAERDGIIIAGCIVLYGQQFAHYHLGASDPAELGARPNHLLFAEMIRRAKALGKTALHLGGGTTRNEDDSLLAYKRSFSHRQTSFTLGTSVLHPLLYRQLSEQHLAHNVPSSQDWFPAYRTPVRQLSPRGEQSS